MQSSKSSDHWIHLNSFKKIEHSKRLANYLVADQQDREIFFNSESTMSAKKKYIPKATQSSQT